MIRLGFILVILLLFTSFKSEEYIIGKYNDFLGNSIELKSDSTYYFSFRFDLNYSWTSGTYSVKNDTVFLKAITVFDTIMPNNNIYTPYTLVRSVDEISEVMNQKEYDLSLNTNAQQNLYDSPTKLYKKKNRLYLVYGKGEVLKNKQKKFGTRKKYPPYYKKVEE